MSGEQRTQAQTFFDFLGDPQNDLRDLNRDGSMVFTALVAVPNSHKVKTNIIQSLRRWILEGQQNSFKDFTIRYTAHRRFCNNENKKPENWTY